MRSSFVCILLLICSVYGANSDNIYSSYTCTTVEGADPKDLSARTCILHNVCLDRVEEGQAIWSYFVDPKKPNDVPLLDTNFESGEIAAMSYRNGLNMKIDLVHNRKFNPKNYVDESRVTAAFCTPTNNYVHFVLDGMFGLHWLLTHYGYADEETGVLSKRSNIEILDLCRQSKQAQILHGLFTDVMPSSGRKEVGYCYANLIVGPAGHYTIHGYKTSDPVYSTAKDFDRFRNFLIDRYGDKTKEPSKVVVSFRAKETMLLNVLELVDALKKKYDEVELVELAHTPFEKRVNLLSQAKVFVSVVSDDLTSISMLPKDSTVVSIVPYGNGNADRIWRPMAKRFGVKYTWWKNEDRDKAVFHPEILKDYGLSEKDADAIINSDKFKPDEHHWVGEFYWSMVDTIVDVDAVIALVDQAMNPTAEGSNPAGGKVEL